MRRRAVVVIPWPLLILLFPFILAGMALVVCFYVIAALVALAKAIVRARHQRQALIEQARITHPIPTEREAAPCGS